MRVSAQRACVMCFRATLLIGVAWTGFGLFIIPMRPWFQLDVVLTPEELADTDRKEATLEMLQQAAGNAWLFWTGAGLILILISVIGLMSANRLKQPEQAA